MNISAFISVISAIVTLLLIFVRVDEKEKILISLKVFVFLVFVISFIIFLISLLPHKTGDKDLHSEEITVHADGQNLNDKNENESSNNSESTDITSSENVDAQEESINEFSEPESNNNTDIMRIDSIIDNEHTVSIIEDSSFEIQPVNIINYSGEISNDGQCNDYEYVPSISGTHRFEFSNVPNGTDFRLRLLNSGWEQITAASDLDNGDGLTRSLTVGETYYIRVEQYRGLGPYTLNIGPKKEIVDITSYTAVSDSIQYTNQENDYLFVAERDGTYRFEFSNVPNGTDFRLRLFNSGWEQITAASDLDNGDGLTRSLTAGETYYIRVEQYRGLGPYTLNIGPKKEIVDITNYTAVSDSIQYTNQENDYSFVAERGGTYRFEFSNVPNGTDFRLRLFNSGWEQITAASDLDNGDGLTRSLIAGETYYIRVEQYRGLGPYTLNIGPKKEIVDITNYTAVSDSIQYTNQENDYSFVAERDGTYRIGFSNILNGNSLNLEIFNSGWEREKYSNNLGNGSGLNIQFSKGESYFIRVSQYNGVSNYILSVEYQYDQ